MTKEKKQIVWVTGASRGIGRSTAMLLAAHGYVICASARSSSALNAVVDDINNSGGTASAFPLDISDHVAVHAAYQAILQRHTHVDILVNNAGITSFKTFQESTIDEFDAIISTNLRGYYLCTKAVIDAMVQNKKGKIISVHSVAAIKPFVRSSVYSAAKAGALAMFRSLREEVRKSGVQIIDILPGSTETDMWHDAAREKFRHRMMQPEDIAQAILTLVEQSDRMTTDEMIVRPKEGDL